MGLRILIANEGIDDPGGVHTYLAALAAALRARGHALALLHVNPAARASRAATTDSSVLQLEPSICVRQAGLEAALSRVAAWSPGVCFSHNMRLLDVDVALARRWPVVKMMHGYFGTCVSGQKMRRWPSSAPCGRRLDAACLAQFLPRRCGEASVTKMLAQYSWARRQQGLFQRYAGIVVASEHMRDEYRRHGAPGDRLHAIPLFAPPGVQEVGEMPAASADGGPPHVVFLGRMTYLKGGDLLVRAAARLARAGRPVALTMAGDGPARGAWRALAERLGVLARFPGWLDPAGRADLLSGASALAMPSRWPEPFGLAGLEAAAAGVPAVAFDVGGVREWLRDGESGLLAGSRPDAAALASALDRLLCDAAVRRRLARGARAVAEGLTIDRHVDTLVNRVLAPAARLPVPA